MQPTSSSNGSNPPSPGGVASVSTLPPFKKIRLIEPQSKFELYGDRIIKYLFETKLINDKRIHEFQRDAVLKTRGLLLEDSGKRLQEDVPGTDVKPVLIVAPTGSGKSGMIALLPYVLKSRKVIVLTPSKVISTQLGEAFGEKKGKKSFFEKVGITTDIVDDESDPTKLLEMPKIIRSPSDITQDREILNNVVIVNAQKFGGNSGLSLVYKDKKIVDDVLKFFELFDTLLVDEAHHYPAKTWKNIVDAFSRAVEGMDKKIVFLTATPFRSDPKAEGGKSFILKHLGTETEAKQRIAFEITSKALEGSAIRAAEFIERDNSSTLARDIFDQLEKQSIEDPRFVPQALVIVRTKEEARNTVATINSSLSNDNFAVAVISEKQSDELTEDFTKGKYRVAVVCGLLKEGYDNPKVTLCVIVRNIRSRILFSQFVGRCLRINRAIPEDKSKGVILSYKEYQQSKLWEEREALAQDDEDPIEVDED